MHPCSDAQFVEAPSSAGTCTSPHPELASDPDPALETRSEAPAGAGVTAFARTAPSTSTQGTTTPRRSKFSRKLSRARPTRLRAASSLIPSSSPTARCDHASIYRSTTALRSTVGGDSIAASKSGAASSQGESFDRSDFLPATDSRSRLRLRTPAHRVARAPTRLPVESAPDSDILR